MLQDPVYERVFDVLVVGAGLSGLFAASILSKKGLRVAVVAQGIGAVASSTGFVDVLKQTPEGKPADDLRDAFAVLHTRFPDHPYAKTGWEKLITAEDYFLELTEGNGLKYRRPSLTANVHAVTAFGLLKSTHLVPEAAALASVLRHKKVTILSLAGYNDFNAALIQGNLAGLLPSTKIYRAQAHLPGEKSLKSSFGWKSLTIARRFDDEDERERLIKALKEAMRGRETAQVILLPAVLGLDDHPAVWRAVRESLGVEVFEVPTLPPSVAGLRLFNSLKKTLDILRVHLNLNCRAIRSGIFGDRVDYVDVAGEGRVIRYRARYFILASGGIVGGGLVERDARIFEPLFGSPLTGAGRASYRDFHFDTGVAVDQDLCIPGFTNVLACGRVLGSYNPYSEGCGNGVALATALKASETVKGEAVG
ncbi:anaerobic glycerol-3-phosphate dehydrogenase subunit B [Moorella thermoacetica]|uniref:Anaerobic glycerol-3-phosphate dehydrogenase subunit B n=1 Tax=Neomoorella thermoacetica TaxID=1525 RepID=A0A1J5JF42_NEOTH|nr:anaerobic glycerol-3-phosphate dehydrogenase subunit GlpB [Moorella thermoacetica]OIQ08150.1 anaerobic glycerol-3-phosphate dehydrogenase subunit B [Moorella thermoacetica]